jgi:hypothetical protein
MTLTIEFPAAPEGEHLAEAHNVACQSFALCDRAATGGYAHPVLGAVLSCQRCADKLEQTLEPASVSAD